MKRKALNVVALLVILAAVSTAAGQPAWQVLKHYEQAQAAVYAYDQELPVFTGAKVYERPTVGGPAVYAGMAMSMNGFPVDALLLTYRGLDAAGTAHFTLRAGGVPFGKQDAFLAAAKATKHDGVAGWISTAASQCRRWALDEQYNVVAAAPSTIRLQGMAYEVVLHLRAEDGELMIELGNIEER